MRAVPLLFILGIAACGPSAEQLAAAQSAARSAESSALFRLKAALSQCRQVELMRQLSSKPTDELLQGCAKVRTAREEYVKSCTAVVGDAAACELKLARAERD